MKAAAARLRPFAEAVRVLREAAAERPLSSETVALAQAAGRVCGESVLAPAPLPRFDNSSMDGYAARAAATAGATPERPAVLPVAGTIAAGDAPREGLCSSKGRASGVFQIMTGAPIPPGCDAVVRVEDTELLSGGERVAVKTPADVGDYIRRAGADFKTGDAVAASGTIVEPAHILALGALGVGRLRVRRKAKVAVIATGRELTAPGDKAAPGGVHDGSSAFLLAVLRALGAEASHLGACADDPQDFEERLRRAAGWGADVVVATGAVSMGKHDFVPATLERLGAHVLFHRVAMRPGKPVLAACLREGALFIGLPGNPVSTVVGSRFFLCDALRAMAGRGPEEGWPARLEEDIQKPEGLTCFYKARAVPFVDGMKARVLERQESFHVSSLLETSAWAVLPEGDTRLKAGTVVPLFPRLPGLGWGPL